MAQAMNLLSSGSSFITSTSSIPGVTKAFVIRLSISLSISLLVKENCFLILGRFNTSFTSSIIRGEVTRMYSLRLHDSRSSEGMVPDVVAPEIIRFVSTTTLYTFFLPYLLHRFVYSFFHLFGREISGLGSQAIKNLESVFPLFCSKAKTGVHKSLILFIIHNYRLRFIKSCN